MQRDHLYILAAIAALGLCSASAFGQGRGALSVGSMRNVGDQSGFGSTAFQSYSYGLGGMSRGGGGGGGVLSSSAGSQNVSRRGAGITGDSGLGMSAGRSGSNMKVLYRPSGTFLPDFGPRRNKLGSGDAAAAGIAMAGAFGVTEMDLRKAPEPLASFVPAGTDTGLYVRYLRQGEEAFRVAKYDVAQQKFQTANDFGRRVPESLLSLAHASFGMGQYASMAYYLRMTLTYFPELPLANISLRGFFRDAAEFVRMRQELRQELAQTPEDATLWFSLAYVEWFDGNSTEAADALRKAVQITDDPLLSKAIMAFWDGCVASGRISGELPTQPAATSQPAVTSTGTPSPEVN